MGRVALLAIVAWLVFPLAVHALTVDMAVKGEGGIAILTVPGPDFSGTFVLELHVSSDGPLTGLQYSLIATRLGATPGNANAQFAFNGDVASGDVTFGSDLVAVGTVELDKFQVTDYIPGYDLAGGVVRLDEVQPELFFRDSSETAQSRFPGKLISYTLKAARPVPAGTYMFTVGDGGAGLKATNQAEGDVVPRIVAGFRLVVSSTSSGTSGSSGDSTGTGSSTGDSTGDASTPSSGDTGTNGDGGEVQAKPSFCAPISTFEVLTMLSALSGLAVIQRRRHHATPGDPPSAA